MRICVRVLIPIFAFDYTGVFRIVAEICLTPRTALRDRRGLVASDKRYHAGKPPMPHKLAKYLQAYTDNRGKHRYYFRRQGFVRVALPAPWDDGCLKAYETANTDKGP